MSKTNLTEKIGRTFMKAQFQLKKHSPEILLVTGVIGTVVGTVMACRATRKIDDILCEHAEVMDTIHETIEEVEKGERADYSIEDGQKDITITYAKTGMKLVKLYAPSVIIGALSIGSIVASNNIVQKRYIAASTALAGVSKGFKEYRNSVVERFGENVDRELRYGIKAEEINETVTDENGEQHTEKKTVETVDPTKYSPFAKFFDEASPCWQKDSEYNRWFLEKEERHANDLLKANGYLFLNDVYDRLGIPRTKAGQIMGWVYNEENPVGDNFVDFGIYNAYKTNARDFVNGYERSILLDFNVDGNVLELMSGSTLTEC